MRQRAAFGLLLVAALVLDCRVRSGLPGVRASAAA